MATRQLLKAKAYVAELARRLKCRWEVDVRSARISTDYARITKESETRATLLLGARFWTASADVKRLVVAHEIVHLLVWHLASLVPDTHASSRNDAEECLVESVSELVAPSLPSWEEF